MSDLYVELLKGALAGTSHAYPDHPNIAAHRALAIVEEMLELLERREDDTE